MTKPLTQTTVPETTVSENTTAAPAARKKTNMAAKKKTSAQVTAVPFSLSDERLEQSVIGTGTAAKVVTGKYNFYTGLTAGFMIAVRQMYPKATFGKAEYAVALACLFGVKAGGAHKASPAAISDWLADTYRAGTQHIVIKTLMAAITGVPQDGMDAGTAPHTAELHRHYKANWAAYLTTEEGKALRGGTAAASVPTQTPGFGFGSAAVAKAAGGQQALTVQEQIAAAEERARKALARVEAMKRATLGE